MLIWHAILLGLLEGLTEFLPVSSTGHILLAGHFLGFKSPGKTFEVLIQLGAIAAIAYVYFGRLFGLVKALPYNPQARAFVVGLCVAFLPAAVIGVLLHEFIKGVLFETPMLICVMLIAGGIALLFIDRIQWKPFYNDAYALPPELAFKIGLCQTLAMIPGVSRSGSTIVGALLLGVDKRAAAEFSFFLALPTMAGAFVYDLYKNWHALEAEDGLAIGVGFIAAFVMAVIVVRHALDFIGRHGFTPFGWWRILVGALGLAALGLTG